METYKIGNKVSGIIRTVSTDNIGDVTITYANQPYTTFEGFEATFTFKDVEKKLHSGFNDLMYNKGKISEIKISNLLLTEKIMNLIFSKNDEKLCSVFEHYVSDDDAMIYLNTDASTIYQVFIYNTSGTLESAEGTHSGNTIQVNDANKDYLIVYSFVGTKAFNFESLPNIYIGLDLIVEGNVNDSTAKMYMHFDKCAIKVDRTMYFNKNLNAIDLVFTVLDDSESYITLK